MAEAFLNCGVGGGGAKAMTRFPLPTTHIQLVHMGHVQFIWALDPRFLLLVSAIQLNF